MRVFANCIYALLHCVAFVVQMSLVGSVVFTNDCPVIGEWCAQKTVKREHWAMCVRCSIKMSLFRNPRKRWSGQNYRTRNSLNNNNSPQDCDMSQPTANSTIKTGPSHIRRMWMYGNWPFKSITRGASDVVSVNEKAILRVSIAIAICHIPYAFTMQTQLFV